MSLVRDHFELLSPRQKEVALLLTDGLSNKDIAECLGTTVHTVKAHRAEVMRRMEAFTFADLVGKILSLRQPPSALKLYRSRIIRIIMVEDDPWYRDYLTDNLKEHGYAAIGVADKSEFDRAWTDSPADIVILDIELGTNKEDGIAIAAKLHENSVCGIIVVTAHGDTHERVKGLSVGVDAYFSKPVNINELVLTIANLWHRLLPPSDV